MSLLLLFSVPKEALAATATATCVSDFTGAAESRASLLPFAEINTFVSGVASLTTSTVNTSLLVESAGDLTGNGYQQNQYPSVSVPGASGSNVLLYLSTAVATALVHEISSFNFLPFDSTVDFSAAFPGVATVDGVPYDSTQHTDGVVSAVSAVGGVAEDRLALQPNATGSAVSGASATPYDTTQNANAPIHAISETTAVGEDRLSIQPNAVASVLSAVVASAEDRAAKNSDASFDSVSAFVSVPNKSLLLSAAVVGISALGITIPPRSFAVAASAGGGRNTTGTVT